jgi:hypothetical protein
MFPRALFTDGWNSFWHFVFGVIGGNWWILAPFFVLYQLIFYDKNSYVDVCEFACGYCLSIVVAASSVVATIGPAALV